MALKSKRVSSQHRPAQSVPETAGTAKLTAKILFSLFILVVLATIAFKIHKADSSGIGYDEQLTLIRYCDSVHTAMHSFVRKNASSTNNHVLNSIFIHYGQKFFSSYEHYIRIPSLLAGIISSLAMAYIIYQTVRSRFIRIVSLPMVTLVPFVFEYSYYARGYAFAMAGIYAAMAFVIWLIKHRVKFSYWPAVALVIVGLNFLCLGSMISSLIMLLSFNAVFVLLYSHRVFQNAPGRIKPTIINTATIFTGTLATVFWLYHAMYLDMINSRSLAKIAGRWKGWPSFVDYFHNLLIRRVFRPDDIAGTVVLYATLLLLASAVVFYMWKLRQRIKARTWREYLEMDTPAAFVLILSGVTLTAMFVNCIILNRSPGLYRSQVFLIPQVLIAGVIIVDKFVYSLKPNALRIVVHTFAIVIIASITLHNLPYDRFISGPLLRKLKAIDPDKTWTIGFSESKKLRYLGFQYYRQFDYKFQMAPGGSYSETPDKFDIFVCGIDERPLDYPCLDWDYFKRSRYAIVVNTPLPHDKIVYEARMIEPK